MSCFAHLLSRSGPENTFCSLEPEWPIYPPITCDNLLQYAAQDNTQLHLGRLLPELRAYVDRFLAPVAWATSGNLERLDLPEFDCFESAHWWQFIVTLRGERVLVATGVDKTSKVRYA